MNYRSLMVTVALCMLAGSASAADIYINGVKVTGAVRAQAFQGVNVQFDANGDVYIDAPGFKVERPEAPVAKQTEKDPMIGQSRLWLVVNNKELGHYRVLVKIDGKKVADVASTRRQSLTDVSDHLRQGKNDVEIVFLPIPDAPRIGEKEGIEVLVGIGKTEADGSLTISRVLGSDKHKTGSRSAEAHTLPVVVP